MNTESLSFEETGGSADRLENRPPLALIAGPTASGKSSLAIALAHHQSEMGRQCVVVNADSAQVYADLQVLSARPTTKEMAGVEHRLFGTIDGAQACSAARWAQDARAVIAEVQQRGALPILVGGTGLYIRTLLDGIAPVPEIDPDIRAAVRALETPDALAALRAEDPDRAAQLHANDTTRIARALEIVRSTGIPMAEWQARRTGGIGVAVSLRPLILLPPREWLYERCDQRFEAMMDEGAIAEAERLLARKLDPDLPVMRAIGVREVAAFVRGETDRSATIAAGQLATRQYAKRQYTWFRNQPPDQWRREECEISSVNVAKLATLFQV